MVRRRSDRSPDRRAGQRVRRRARGAVWSSTTSTAAPGASTSASTARPRVRRPRRRRGPLGLVVLVGVGRRTRVARRPRRSGDVQGRPSTACARPHRLPAALGARGVRAGTCTRRLPARSAAASSTWRARGTPGRSNTRPCRRPSAASSRGDVVLVERRGRLRGLATAGCSTTSRVPRLLDQGKPGRTWRSGLARRGRRWAGQAWRVRELAIAVPSDRSSCSARRYARCSADCSPGSRSAYYGYPPTACAEHDGRPRRARGAPRPPRSAVSSAPGVARSGCPFATRGAQRRP